MSANYARAEAFTVPLRLGITSNRYGNIQHLP